MSQDEAEAHVQNLADEVQIPTVRRKEANRNSKTGVRGVSQVKNGMFRASVQVHKEIRVKFFTDIDKAKEWRDATQKELIAKYNVDLGDGGTDNEKDH